MAVPSDESLISPILVGRADATARLTAALDSARAGSGRVVFVSGEAGIGKSRLLTETRQTAAARHVTAAEGRCFEPDRSLPFAPLVELLRGLLADDALDDSLRRFITASPELTRLLPELGQADAVTVEPDKRRLFDLLAQLFLRMSGAHALVILLEDLHWSDPASLEFLAYFARRIARARILLLLTYRSDEPTPELLTLLADLERERIAAEITLSPLTRADTLRLMNGMLGACAVPDDLADSIYGLTEGNPFFVEEIVKSMVVTGEITCRDGVWQRVASAPRLPRTVLVAVQQRLSLLTRPAHDVLVLAAVAGRRFDFSLLQSLTAHDEDRLIDLIKELIGAQLVIEESAESFAFRHALTREAVTLTLLARERRRLHATVAQAMERLYADTLDAHSADLTYQFDQAEVWPKVLDYAPKAAEQAQSLYSPRAAVSLYTQAIEAAERAGSSATWAIYRGRGLAYETIGEFDAAHADYIRALEIAGDARLEWQSTLDLGFLWTGRDFERAGAYFRQALDRARTLDDPTALGHSLNRVGNWYQNHLEQPVVSVGFHREALAALRPTGDLKGVAATFDLLGTSSYFCGEIVQGASYYEEAIALFRRLNDRQGLVASLVMFATRGANYLHETVTCPVIDLAEASQDAELAVQMARDLDWRAGESFALSYLCFGLGAQGVYGPASSAGQRALTLALDVEHGLWIAASRLALGTLALDLLDLPAAAEHLERSLDASRQMSTLFVIRMSSAFLASTYVRQNRLNDARAVLDAALGAHEPINTLARRRIALARAELALASGEPESALTLLDGLAGSDVIPTIGLLRGRVLLGLHRLDEAETTLRDAEDSARQHGLKPPLWRIHTALAQGYQARGESDAAANEIAAAQAVVAELAASLSEPERSRYGEQAAALMPKSGGAARPAYDGLTRREREIAALAARGYSNREIAETLVISERTVDTHVSNMLGKLGFTSRRQIARWAVEHGLV